MTAGSESRLSVPTTPDAGAKRQMDELFRMMQKVNASDLHLKAGAPPLMRIADNIQVLKMQALAAEQVQRLVYSILRPEQAKKFEVANDLDFSYQFDEGGRVRVSVFRDRGTVNLAARLVKSAILGFEELHLPPILGDIASAKQGLVLICGPTGSGKSTTLAAMVQHINRTRRCHIVTIEDPIEFLFKDDKSFIHQRELGVDVESWDTALKHVVRQDPDVIVIGEMRDAATFTAGLRAAETGHLVFGTLHSADVAQSMSRVFDMFPSDEREAARRAMSLNIHAVICMKLLRSCLQGVPLAPALEIMIANPTVRRLIREAEEGKLLDAIRAGKDEGMCDFTQTLVELVKKDWVTTREAQENAPNADELKMALRGVHLTHKGFVG
ncbi:MAG: PilT/PilU family type 4a pilus ATPase [Planctomycetes bacterium]|nr:PilT/PilU family type 4a pilus ATPase [Planctomycetota bacterium]